MAEVRLATSLGITGGVASGKSTVAGFFAERGARRVSADEIARDLLAPGSETTKVVLAHFGAEFALESGQEQIDRKKLAQRVFSDEAARIELGKIMHPQIRRVMLAEIESARADLSFRLIAVEIPLLFENHLEGIVDQISVVSCSENVQLERLRARQPWLDTEAALRQIRSQIPISEKIKRADYVVDTDRPRALVHGDVDAIFDTLTA